jgi:hypothetical protein
VTTAGYSGTPLARKLGIAEGNVVTVSGAPGHMRELLDPLPGGVTLASGVREADVIVFFTKERAALSSQIERLGAAIFPGGSCWIAWPKRSSKVPTDMTEDVVREIALPLGLVDNKVCAIDETWSGLRLVWRKERRSA